jgi:hypothetical protein
MPRLNSGGSYTAPMIDCYNNLSTAPSIARVSSSFWTALCSPYSAIRKGAAVDYNPRYRGKRSYDPLLCLESNSSFLWDVELRRRDAGTWAGGEELLACCFQSAPSDIRELRARADAGFDYGPILDMPEALPAQYAVVARMLPSLKRALPAFRYEPMNPRWEIAEFEHHPHDWAHARRCIVARRKIEETDPEPTLFTLKRYAYRAWHTNLPLSPAGSVAFL